MALVAATAVPVSVAVGLGVSRMKISGSAVAEAVWSYSARSLTKMDDLSIKAWGRVGRVAGKSSESPVAEAKEQDRPVEAPDPVGKLNSTDQVLSQLLTKLQVASSELGLVGLEWERLTIGEVTESVDNLLAMLVETENQLAWLTRAWEWPQLRSVVAQVSQAKGSLVTMRNIVSTTGLQPIAYAQLKTALKSLETAEELVGGSTDSVKNQSVFGWFQKIKAEVEKWEGLQEQTSELLATWEDITFGQRETEVANIYRELATVNKIV